MGRIYWGIYRKIIRHLFCQLYSEKIPSALQMGFFSVKFVPYGTSEIRWRVWNCLRQWNTPVACGGTNFISHLAEPSEAGYFTISEGNNFTFAVRRIFHFVLLDTSSALCYTKSEKTVLLCSKNVPFWWRALSYQLSSHALVDPTRHRSVRMWKRSYRNCSLPYRLKTKKHLSLSLM